MRMFKPFRPRDELTFLDGAVDPDAAYMSRYGDTDWLVNDTPLVSYIEDAALEPDLVQEVAHRISGNNPSVGLEIAAGANGTALQDMLKCGILGRALMINYEDTRNREVPDIDQVTGNILTRHVWKQILSWQRGNAPHGFSLVMHRPARALQDLPPSVYAGASGLLLDMLAPGGVLFTQIPSSLACTEQGRASLQGMYRSITARGDIERVVVSPQQNPTVGPITDLGHAVILKTLDS